MRKLIKVAILVASLGCRTAPAETIGAVVTSTTTSASTPEVASLGKVARWSAPVGHRQPHASDLPSENSSELEHISEQDRAIDRKLIICRGC